MTEKEVMVWVVCVCARPDKGQRRRAAPQPKSVRGNAGVRSKVQERYTRHIKAAAGDERARVAAASFYIIPRHPIHLYVCERCAKERALHLALVKDKSFCGVSA
jgi:hypothetical protein